MPLTSDFVNNDPSAPLPRGPSRLGNSNEILIITTGTLRHQLPRKLINAYASFYRHNAHTHPVDFARALGTLLASALEPPPPEFHHNLPQPPSNSGTVPGSHNPIIRDLPFPFYPRTPHGEHQTPLSWYRPPHTTNTLPMEPTHPQRLQP